MADYLLGAGAGDTLALVSKDDNVKIGSEGSITPASGFSGTTAKAVKQPNGSYSLKGTFTKSSFIASADFVGTIANGFATASQRTAVCSIFSGSSFGTANLTIQSNGNINLYNPSIANAIYVYFDGIFITN